MVVPSLASTKLLLRSLSRQELQKSYATTFLLSSSKQLLGNSMLLAAQQHVLLCRRSFGTWPKVKPRRIRVITMDVTGTLVSFRGTLEDHYLGAAKKCGIQLANDLAFADAFRTAYREVSRLHPCFGNREMSAKEWWKLCVLRSFELAGCEMTESQQDRVFQRIYSTFGSHAAYEKFDDALPFLNWARRHKIVCGILSNADERYGDSILPMLDFTADDLQLQCYSKDFGVEKPDSRFYLAALREAESYLPVSISDDGDALDTELLPSQCLHIGNDYVKDFEGARRAGMHAILLDRYGEKENADEWRRRGALCFKDLLDVVEFLGHSGCKLG